MHAAEGFVYPLLASLALPVLVFVTGLISGLLPIAVSAQLTADVTANGESGAVTLSEPQALTLGVSLAPGAQAGQAADWWLVGRTPQKEWVYYRHPAQWINVGLDWSRMAAGHQGPLVGVADLPLPGPRYLAAGTHTVYFGVDMAMNAQLDIDSAFYNSVSVTVPPFASSRLSRLDLTYQGAFRLPDALNWGARGVSYHAAGNGGAGSLLVTAFQGLLTPGGEPCYEGLAGCAAYFAEVATPTPVPAANWEELPVAELVREPTVFDGGLVATVEEAYSFVSGIQYVPRQGSQTSDKIYGSLNVWYPEGVFGDASFPTIWFSELDGSNPRGVFHVGPSSDPVFHGRRMGEYLFMVPQWYADTYLGGRTLVTGRSRGTPLSDGVGGAMAGGSQGPTLFAFQPWQSDRPSGDLNAVAMLYYRAKYPECAGPDIGVGGQPVDCDYPGFSMCDQWSGAGFVERGSKRAIVILGHKGCTNCYYCDETATDPECHATPRPGECDRRCNESRGYHCGPYKRQVIFYDVDELGQVVGGARSPWSVLPYQVWEPTEFYLTPTDGNTCGDVGGMTYDSAGARLFMVERGLGGYDNQNAALVHVWSVAGGD